MRSRHIVLSLFLVLLSLAFLAPAAFATTNYGTVSGSNFDFVNIRDTSTYGDPEPACCFGTPTTSVDNLLFFPTSFSASAAGAGGFDQTGSQLQVDIESTNPLAVIEAINITEFGDTILTGIGTGATGAFVSMSGVVTVTEALGSVITPVLIPFTGTFTQDLFGLPTDLGTTLWQGDVSVDVASAVFGATKATLSFDNDLTVYSEAGTTSEIQKKPVVVITVVPEPGTAILFGIGLLGLATQGRGRRA